MAEKRSTSGVVPREIGGATFDPYDGMLVREDLQRIVLRPQTAAVLEYFLDRPGQLLHKQTLLDALWPRKSVTEDSLVQCISEIRKALRDDRHEILVTNPKRGYRFVPPQRPLVGTSPNLPSSQQVERTQVIRFARNRDDIAIAYTVGGSGYPVVQTATWLTCIDYEHKTFFWPKHRRMMQHFELLRYNGRALGMSGGVEPAKSMDEAIADLQSVVDAAGYDRFAIRGESQGAPVAIAYAARHPERVSHLVLTGGFAAGAFKRGLTESQLSQYLALNKLIETQWGLENPALSFMMAAKRFPGAPAQSLRDLAEWQQRVASSEIAARHHLIQANFDVRDELSRVRCPTLVFHCSGDPNLPPALGREIADGIDGARFVLLDSMNHYPLEGEPAFEQMFGLIESFLPARDGVGRPASFSDTGNIEIGTTISGAR